MLDQAEADALLAMPKEFVDGSTIRLGPGTKQVRELLGDDLRERFFLSLYRGRLRLTKASYSTRARMAVVLARLDLDPAPHTNPDGQLITGPHLHVYRAGYEAKWAYPLDPAVFQDPADLGRSFVDFCRYCSMRNPPPFQDVLL